MTEKKTELYFPSMGKLGPVNPPKRQQPPKSSGLDFPNSPGMKAIAEKRVVEDRQRADSAWEKRITGDLETWRRTMRGDGFSQEQIEAIETGTATRTL